MTAVSIGVNHAFVSAVTDSPGATRVGKDRWNADHVIDEAAVTKAMLAADASLYLIPAGGIIMWSGSTEAVPDGWYLCDGATRTIDGSSVAVPDLRGRFVIGSTGTTGDEDAGDYGLDVTTGGGAAVAHAFTTPVSIAAEAAHTHAITAQTTGTPSDVHSNYTLSGSGSAGSLDHTHSLTGTTAAGSSHTHALTAPVITDHAATAVLPPYYVLAYIIKS